MSRVPASPHFLGPLKRALVATLAILGLLAVCFPAPLEIPADPMTPPNPAKSAWFLLWIQELVSHHALAIYPALALALLLIALPWLPATRVQRAGWFQRPHRAIWIATLIAFAGIVVLTVLALFFRGADWCLVAPL